MARRGTCDDCGKPIWRNNEGEWEHERRTEPDARGGRRVAHDPTPKADEPPPPAPPADPPAPPAPADPPTPPVADPPAPPAPPEPETPPKRDHVLHRRIGGTKE